jgi:peptide/nickel transport system permease protein
MTSEEKKPPTTHADLMKAAATNTAQRLGKFMLARLAMLFVTIVIGIYITILIANMGGYVDTIMKNNIRESVIMTVAAQTANKNVSSAVRQEMIDTMIALQEKRVGLDQPRLARNFRFLKNALTLDLGRATFLVSDHGSRLVRNIILERLPATLLLMSTSQLILFFVTLFLALRLSRHYGSFFDKLVITLSPTSSIPPWFYGILVAWSPRHRPVTLGITFLTC